MPEIKVLRAMFDVKPVDESGRVNFKKISNLPDVVKLKSGDKSVKKINPDFHSPVPANLAVSRINPDRENVLDEFKKVILQKFDPIIELANIGAELHDFKGGRPKKQGYMDFPQYQPSKDYFPPDNLPVIRPSVEIASALSSTASHEEYPSSSTQPEETALASKNENLEKTFDDFMLRKTGALSPVAREVDVLLEQYRPNANTAFPAPVQKVKPFSVEETKTKKKWLKLFAFLILSGTLFFVFVRGGMSVKNDIVSDGNKAVLNLEKARTDLEDLNFLSAANNFALAEKNFSEASKKLNLMGASFISIFADVPGLKKIKSAKNLVEAGENIAQAGESLSAAFDDLSHTNFVAYFGSEEPPRPLSSYVENFKKSLVFSENKISKSQKLLASIDDSLLPEEKRALFLDFKEKIPQFRKFIGEAVDYSDFLLKVVGNYELKKYLILFQNNSELRPTGGFPGTYGLLEFEDGYLENIFVDDIYNIDGQISANITPPKELQHITPTWGMRDANWFADFPTSAKKVMEMYELDGGAKTDGVFSVTPTVISRILSIIGPVEMPEYGVTLDSDNFLAQVQEEVEYGDNKKINKPKKIVTDFTPIFISKLAGQDKENWLKIFQILVEALNEKQILGYFADPDLQKVSVENGFAGEVKKTDGDFLLVTHSNVKGSKTDAVIKNSIGVETEITENGFIRHTLKITRIHNGGRTPFGFYNRQNPDFIRVTVPNGSELLEIEGHSLVSPIPIIGEYDSSFEVDEDLENYESQAVTEKGVKIFHEADKIVFGFWLVLDPGKTKTVTLKYLTPVKTDKREYSILIQKQPGTISDKLSFKFAPPQGSQVFFKYPSDFQIIGKNLILDSDLLTDRMIGIKWAQ